MLYFGASWMDMVLWQVRVHEHLLTDDDKDPRTIKRYRDEIFRSYISRVSKRPAFVKAFADAHAFQVEAPDGSTLLERFTG